MLAARNLKKNLAKVEVDKQNHAKLMMGEPTCLDRMHSKKICGTNTLSLFVLFQEHDTICIRYNNASAF